MNRFIVVIAGLSLGLSCTHHQDTSGIRAPQPDPAQTVIHGTWALPVETIQAALPGGEVERKDDEIRVRLSVEHFEKPGFNRYGYWDQSGTYEHTYGGDHSGSFSYRFVGLKNEPRVLEIKARLSAESSTRGKPNETSDVTLFINGVAIGRQTVMPDDGIGRSYVWRVKDPTQIRKLRLAADSSNELRFVVDKKARQQNGLCIYGKALDASAPEPGEPITIVYRLDNKGDLR